MSPRQREAVDALIQQHQWAIEMLEIVKPALIQGRQELENYLEKDKASFEVLKTILNRRVGDV